MNTEWLELSNDLQAALIREHWFTAWKSSKILFEQLEAFTDALLDQKSESKDL